MTNCRLAFLVSSFALSLNGCPLGTPNDHYRPHGHQDTTIDVSTSEEALLFNAKGAGGRDLYLLRLSDLSVTRIAETPDYEVSPAFSPDGKSVVYAAGVPGDRADHIFTVQSDGTGKTQLTTAEANDTQPCYSPDGKTIAFARDKTYGWGGLAANWSNGGVICVVNADGTNERQLTSDEDYSYSPCFSADGESVVYSTQSGLFSVPIAGNVSPTRLGPTGTHMAVASNGEDIVFADGVYSPDHELFVAKVDGSRRKQITQSRHGCFHPVFNRDGDRVYFLMEQWPNGQTGPPQSSVWSVTADGAELRLIVDLSLFDDVDDAGGRNASY